MTKRIFVLLFIVLFAFASFTGCKKSTEKNETESEKQTQDQEEETEKETEAKSPPVKATAFIRARETTEWDGSQMQQLILEKFNLDLSVEIGSLSQYKEMIKLRLAAGQIPDMAMTKGTDEEVKVAGDKGMFVNILDYLDIMPNHKKFLNKYSNSLVKYLSPEGKLYTTLEVQDHELRPRNTFYARKDILDKMGFDIFKDLNDWEDFYTMLVKLKEGNDGKPPMAFEWDFVLHKWAPMFGAGGHNQVKGSGSPVIYWSFDEQKWEGGMYRPNMKEFVKYLKTLWDEELIHRDTFTIDEDKLWELMLNGEVTITYGGTHEPGMMTEGSVVEGAYWSYMIQPEHKGIQYKTSGMPGTIGMMNMINAKSKAIEELLRFNDWLLSEEGYFRSRFGIEGTDYVRKPDLDSMGMGYAFYLLWEDYKETLPEEYHEKLLTQEEALKRRDTVVYNVNSLSPYSDLWRGLRLYKGDLENMTVEAHNALKDYIYDTMIPTQPWNKEQLEEILVIRDAIETYAQETIMHMMLGKIDIEKEWDTFINKLKDLKYDRLIELYNESLQAYRLKMKEVEGYIN